jgi:hypothetical protein
VDRECVVWFRTFFLRAHCRFGYFLGQFDALVELIVLMQKSVFPAIIGHFSIIILK